MNFDAIGIFAAGLLTFASPCILPLVPVYLALLGGASVSELQDGKRTGRAFLAAVAFTLGLAVVFVGMGMAATAIGRALVAHRTLLLQLGGLAVFLFGLKFLGVLHLPWLEREYRPLLGGDGRRSSVLGAFVIGAAFGLGWTPCIGPVLGSVLTYTAASTSSPVTGGLYLAAYAAGLGLPLVAVAAIAPLALGWIRKLQAWMQRLQYATGAVLAIVGLLLLTDNLGALDPSTLAKPAPVASSLSASGGKAPALATADGGTTAGGVCETSQGSGACAVPAAGAAAAAGVPQYLPSGEPMMVEFVSTTCPVCLRMAPVVAAAERDCAGHSVRVQRVVVDGPGGVELARKHGILGVPSFVFLDAKGAEVARLVGEQKLPTLEQTLQVLSGERCSGFRAFPPLETAPSTPAGPRS